MQTLTSFTTQAFTAELQRRGLIQFSDDEVCVLCNQPGDADGYCSCFQSAIASGGGTSWEILLPDETEQEQEEEETEVKPQSRIIAGGDSGITGGLPGDEKPTEEEKEEESQTK